MEAAAKVQSAVRPEDLFGPVTTDSAAQRAARRLYRTYAPLLHPDRVVSTGLDPIRAKTAFASLQTLYATWQTACASDTAAPDAQDKPAAVVVTGHTGAYVLGDVIGRGTACTIFGATATATAAVGPVAVKMPRKPQSSRFVRNERTMLAAVAETTSQHPWLVPYFPSLLDTATHRATGSNEQRQVNVLNALGAAQGYVSLAQVQRACPAGLDGRDWAWMFRRLLRCLAGVNLAGLVHGAVLSDNVLIHPENHGVVLTGWSFATTDGGALPGMVASHFDTYPPEAQAKGTVTHKTDVYMAARLAETMLHPSERRQRRFARGCLHIAPGMRPTAASLIAEYDDLLHDLYGRRRFRPFHLPATVAENT